MHPTGFKNISKSYAILKFLESVEPLLDFFGDFTIFYVPHFHDFLCTIIRDTT